MADVYTQQIILATPLKQQREEIFPTMKNCSF